MTLRKITIGLVSGVGMLAMSAGAMATDPGAIKFVDGTVPTALTDKAGDAANGKKLAINRKQGNCLACHVITELSNQPFHGEVGPPLDGVADRLSEAELRAMVVDAKISNEDTIMPAFYRVEGLNRVSKKFKDKTILDAQQVEDVVAYLKTLKE